MMDYLVFQAQRDIRGCLVFQAFQENEENLGPMEHLEEKVNLERKVGLAPRVTQELEVPKDQEDSQEMKEKLL